MKSIIALSMLFITTSVLADNYRLKDSLCGEIDPFVIGDACVIVLEKKGEELVIVTDDMEFTEADFFAIDQSALEKVSLESAREYRSVLTRTLNLRRGAKFYSIDSLEALTPVSLAQTEIQFSCQAQGAGNGFLDAQIAFTGILKNTQEFSTLVNLAFAYKLLDGDSVWSEGRTTLAELNNFVAYRPQVYVGMERFNFYFYDRTQRGFGEFDIIMPTKEIVNGKKEFTAYVIMTAIDDHHGDTAAVECQTL